MTVAVNDRDVVEALIETPAGSRNKYEIDPASGVVRLSRRLRVAARFPVDYGYLPGTLGLDGDPLDAIVLTDEPVVVGCHVQGRVVAVLHMGDEHGGDDKILLVPDGDPVFDDVRDLDDVPPARRRELEQFFAHYKDLSPARPRVAGWGTRAIALEEISSARDRARHGSVRRVAEA
jgi:inorganic pyrophosphatase